MSSAVYADRSGLKRQVEDVSADGNGNLRTEIHEVLIQDCVVLGNFDKMGIT